MIIKTYSKLLIFCLLGYIFVVACSRPNHLRFPDDYLCDYVINGTISSADSVALENIGVKIYEITSDLPPKSILRDSCVSDSEGFYEVKNVNAIPYVSNTYELRLSDLNTANDARRDTTITVIFTNENFINGYGKIFLGETFWELNITLDD